MGNKRREDKLVDLFRDADLSELKSYLKKHHLKVNRIALSKSSQTVLHLACLYGRDDVLRYLLKKGGDASLTDVDGNTPLHLAIQRAISGEKYAFQDLVRPLLHKCPGALDVINKNGDSARRLVQLYEKSLENDVTQEDELNAASQSSEEERWNQKLLAEAEFEYGAWAAYEDDFYHDRDEETYEDWVERIRRERWSKRWENTPSSSGGASSQQQKEDEERAKEFQRKLERDHVLYQEKIRRQMLERKQSEMVMKKTLYEQNWTKLFKTLDSMESLSFRDIPWPEHLSKPDILRNFLFCDFESDEETLRKKYLRSQQVRWHPDKFRQKFGHKLLESDKEQILERVKEVSQVINKLSADL